MSKLTLKSSDGEEFLVEESVAIKSETIKNMVEDDCASNTIPVPNVDGKTLAMVIEHCKKHANPEVEAANLKAYDSDFFDKDQAVLYDLIMAANNLDVKDLLDKLCEKVAAMIRGKSPGEIRRIFNIRNDFTLEEEKEILEQNAWAFE